MQKGLNKNKGNWKDVNLPSSKLEKQPCQSSILYPTERGSEHYIYIYCKYCCYRLVLPEKIHRVSRYGNI